MRKMAVRFGLWIATLGGYMPVNGLKFIGCKFYNIKPETVTAFDPETGRIIMEGYAIMPIDHYLAVKRGDVAITLSSQVINGAYPTPLTKNIS